MKEVKKIQNKVGDTLLVEKHCAENAKSTIVFCHGITGCRKGRTMADDYFQVLADKLEKLGYDVVLFDYSGHGESEGNDYDVCLSKSVSELATVFESEVNHNIPINFLAFSYGAAVLNDFLKLNCSIIPERIVLYSPCLYPLDSCFLTDKSIFGKDVLREYNDGTMERDGYATVGAKGFRLGMKMIKGGGVAVVLLDDHAGVGVGIEKGILHGGRHRLGQLRNNQVPGHAVLSVKTVHPLPESGGIFPAFLVSAVKKLCFVQFVQTVQQLLFIHR